jgi:hypothetical protein
MTKAAKITLRNTRLGDVQGSEAGLQESTPVTIDQECELSVGTSLFGPAMRDLVRNLLNPLDEDGIEKVAAKLEHLVRISGEMVEVPNPKGRAWRVDAYTACIGTLWMKMKDDSPLFLSYVAPILEASEGLRKVLRSIRKAAYEAGLVWKVAQQLTIHELQSVVKVGSTAGKRSETLASFLVRSPIVRRRVKVLHDCLKENPQATQREICIYFDTQKLPIPGTWEKQKATNWESAYMAGARLRNCVARLITGCRKKLPLK